MPQIIPIDAPLESTTSYSNSAFISISNSTFSADITGIFTYV